MIWGCLIGLPSFLIAELASTTTIFETRWGDFTPTEDIIGLLYLVNGVLCLFVFEALRRPRVVSVMIPLRRVTILGLSLSVPVLLLHHEIERIQEHLGLPGWAWIALGAAAVFALTRLHEGAVHLVDGYFNREIDAAGQRLGQAIREAKRPAEIDRLLADETYDALKLASAASFRREGPVFARDGNGKGWDRDKTTKIKADEPLLAAVHEGKPFPLKDGDGDGLELPSGLSRPVLAVPAVNPVRCFAVSLYGPHASGTDLDVHERGILGDSPTKPRPCMRSSRTPTCAARSRGWNTSSTPPSRTQRSAADRSKEARMAIYELDGATPEFPTDGLYWIADTASVIGKVKLHTNVSIWFGSVLRGDNEWIEIGTRSQIQDNATLHTDPGFPLTIGRDCVIGHNVVLHGCTIGNGSPRMSDREPDLASASDRRDCRAHRQGREFWWSVRRAIDRSLARRFFRAPALC